MIFFHPLIVENLDEFKKKIYESTLIEINEFQRIVAVFSSM